MTSTVLYKVKFVQMKSLKFWKLYYSYFSATATSEKIIWFKLQFPEEVIKETRISISDGFVSLHLVFGMDSVYI